MNFANGGDDVVHLRATCQEEVLGQGDGRRADLAVAFQFMKTFAVGSQALGAEEALESARGDRFVEKAVEILLMIDARRGDVFGVERLEELVAGQPAEMRRIVTERSGAVEPRFDRVFCRR